MYTREQYLTDLQTNAQGWLNIAQKATTDDERLYACGMAEELLDERDMLVGEETEPDDIEIAAWFASLQG